MFRDIVSDDKIGSCKVKLDELSLGGPTPADVRQKVDNKLFRKDAVIYLKISYKE